MVGVSAAPSRSWSHGRAIDHFRCLPRPHGERGRVPTRGAMAALHGAFLSERLQPRADDQKAETRKATALRVNPPKVHHGHGGYLDLARGPHIQAARTGVRASPPISTGTSPPSICKRICTRPPPSMRTISPISLANGPVSTRARWPTFNDEPISRKR